MCGSMKVAAQTFQFDAAPDPGQVVMFHGQRYQMLRAEPHIRVSDGQPSAVLVWSSHCARCNDAFEFTTGLTARWVNRRCRACKAPGRMVRRSEPRGTTRITHLMRQRMERDGG